MNIKKIIDTYKRLDLVGKATVLGLMVAIIGLIIPLMQIEQDHKKQEPDNIEKTDQTTNKIINNGNSGTNIIGDKNILNNTKLENKKINNFNIYKSITKEVDKKYIVNKYISPQNYNSSQEKESIEQEHLSSKNDDNTNIINNYYIDSSDNAIIETYRPDIFYNPMFTQNLSIITIGACQLSSIPIISLNMQQRSNEIESIPIISIIYNSFPLSFELGTDKRILLQRLQFEPLYRYSMYDFSCIINMVYNQLSGLIIKKYYITEKDLAFICSNMEINFVCKKDDGQSLIVDNMDMTGRKIKTDKKGDYILVNGDDN